MLEAVMETVPAGRRVRVARLGAGPPLVLLHGYPDNLQIFGELAPRLAATHDVITFDWPGMGRSEPWPGGATPDHMADRLVALLDAWGIDRTSVVAMDMGGQPALSFAARHPGRLDRLVVMNSLVFPDDATSWEIAVLRRYGWNRFLLERLPGPVFRRAIRTSLPRGERLPPEVQRELWSCFREPAIRGFIAKLCAGYQGTLPSLVALYPRVACPTLVLWGERDRHFPPGHARRLAETIPRARLEILAGGEHWMAWSRAEDVARAVRAFLEDATRR
jgi:pimeloyl-ACP methyl ester carboxylesterase